MIKAVIYDMDGLFADSEGLHTVAWDEFLERFGHKITDIPDEIRRGFTGIRIIDGMVQIKEILNLGDNLEDLYKERERVWIKIVREKLQPMPGAMESLELFRKNGLKTAITSSGSKEYIQTVLDKFYLRKYFDVVVTGDDVKKGKPDPEPYMVTCQKLGLKPEECLVLEDAERGVASAKNAGCKCVAIQNPRTPSQDFSQADLVLDSLEDINMQILKSL
ncbi:MAG: HAD family phosphatase [archaeon]|nr:MAG: HAD family phosphatase [archaeon]